MHETQNQIVIHGDADRVFALAAAVERWPEFLPHYRWVKILDDDGSRRVVQMAARRSRIPVRWTAHQWRDPAARRIRFLHVAGASRGMEVEWRIDPVGDAVHVAIWHALTLHWPVVNSMPGRWVVGELFVKAIAGRTLACLKEKVEAEALGAA
jgi:ribosome-associated toxin RatA of RatAB toxin-antitoxin module